MKLQLEVALLEDNEPLSFHHLKVFHSSCPSGAMTHYRNPATNDHSLRCGCGIEIVFRAGSEGLVVVERTAIDGVHRSLETGTFMCSSASEISVALRP